MANSSRHVNSVSVVLASKPTPRQAQDVALLSNDGAEIDFCYRLRRSAKRKTLEIRVSDGQVTVAAPTLAPLKSIDAFVQSRRHWVLSKLCEQRSALNVIQARGFEAGAQWPYCGEMLTLAIECEPQKKVGSGVIREGSTLHIYLSGRSQKPHDEQVVDRLTQWYKQEASVVLAEKSRDMAHRLGLASILGNIKIRQTKTRWGHCTSKGDLQFNWLIMLAPEPVIDYLVAHEVCHLRHFNHSRAFWTLVESVCPEFRQHRQWLKLHGPGLRIQVPAR
ncbi:M48 family metallopeptidase [Marinibactrum halimedae]|uniref:YgjP-like metallopeptidase domain-containing protein n=1 Tax=Marinibactrum halimedae TaxID=1444977 RepID=A0AA37WNB8_9GAMM|nr:SprT family zinc-dependent metalloprotease [Marinibactrum halimedae]MCD9457809.1 M48 family metallopeptidase [Marinibactrum halimedae]GLS24817.1 hypothetical protein GCM10007877_05310 [Marinibactrum halimedae]